METKSNRGRKTKTIVTDAGEVRPCTRCKEVKPVSEFKRNGIYYTSRCTICIYRAERLAKYNLTEESFNAMWDGQTGLCAVCHTNLEGKRFCVDHCHATGQVRGLLCYSCNSALGKLKDDIEILKSAIRYLSR